MALWTVVRAWWVDVGGLCQGGRRIPIEVTHCCDKGRHGYMATGKPVARNAEAGVVAISGARHSMFHKEDSVRLRCRRGWRVARSFQHVSGGKDGWRRFAACLQRRLEFMGVVGARTRSIFFTPRHDHGLPAASGTVNQMAPPFLSNNFKL